MDREFPYSKPLPFQPPEDLDIELKSCRDHPGQDGIDRTLPEHLCTALGIVVVEPEQDADDQVERPALQLPQDPLFYLNDGPPDPAGSDCAVIRRELREELHHLTDTG